ncbi:MAG: aminotransferase class I/II-fold pyridoxal phosphate-dependent enzyme [Thermoguttaceae bacterium]|nr:aminotransferase class I/II-fold pyridoxal phosphate-dependent enzyme [Thermoguttaceae bacterium]
MTRLDHLTGSFYGPENWVELLQHRAEVSPENVAFRYLLDGEDNAADLTYLKLELRARAIGAWLQSHKMGGQRILLLYPAGLDFIAAFFGCLFAGAVAVPAYPPRKNRSMNRIQAIVNDADARVALTTQTVLDRVEGIIDMTPNLRNLIWTATDTFDFESLANDWKYPEVHPETLAFLQYTSGSTGTPKGVMLSHANLLHNCALIAWGYEHTHTCCGISWLPSYHDMGLIGCIFQPLYIGCKNVMMSPMSFLQKPYRWLNAITKYRGTTSGGPNFAYDVCVRKVTEEQKKTLDLSSWQVAFSGAEPVRAETLYRFYEAFKDCGFRKESFYPCFGLAEATLMVTGGLMREPPVVRWFNADSLSQNRAVLGTPEDHGTRPLVGNGKVLPDQVLAIAHTETGASLPPLSIGEIWSKGPSMAQGYWKNDEATQRTFRAYLSDTQEGPFMRTGDLGFLDENGELFVTGRLKDLIILRGVNIYPQDIELSVERAHPSLLPNAGAAFTVEVDGRERLVVVQEVERNRTGYQEAIDAVRRVVSSEYELPLDRLILIQKGTIPKTSSGKIQRHACRRGFLDGTLEELARWESPEDLSVDTPKETSFPKHTIGRSEAYAREVAEEMQHHRLGGFGGSGPVMQAASTGEENAPDNAADLAKTDDVPINRDKIIETVLEHVRLVARDRATGLTLDTQIAELGLDSLERMEILASLEEKFGGRFPEEILTELETARQVVEAVEKYLGHQPKAKTQRAAGWEPSEETYQIEKFPECVRLQETRRAVVECGLKDPYFTVHEGMTADRTIIGGKSYIHWSSYNYLGMAGDPDVRQGAIDAINRYGTSASASRLVSGEKTIHRELEQEFAKFLGTDETICMVGGHATNESVIGHLFGPGDLVLHDNLAHNSIVEGCMLSGARRRAFPHSDPAALDKILRDYRHEYRRVLIAIEGAYSMDGDIAPLPEFVEVKKRHKALLFVDEAHSLGTLGQTGRGIAEYWNVKRNDVDIWMGTLSKSFGSIGGIISGSYALVQYLRYTAPCFVFSAAMTPPVAGAALTSLRKLEAEPERVEQLHRNSKRLLTKMREQGLNTGLSHDTPVIPVILGNSMLALTLATRLFERGINVQPIMHPAVEEQAARLRFFVTSIHTDEEIDYTAQTVAEELKKLKGE